MGVSKVVYFGEILLDLTADTVTPDTLAEGVTAHDAMGELIRGTFSTEVFAVISATYPAGSTCTCTNGTKTLKAKDTGGSALFSVPSAGTWTVSCTNGTDTASKAVNITTNGQLVSVALRYYVYFYKDGDECNSITGGWRAQLGSITRYSNFLKLNYNTAPYVPPYSIATTTNRISMAGIKTLCFEVQFSGYVGGDYATLGLVTQFQIDASGGDIGSYVVAKTYGTSTNKVLYSVDASSLNSSYFPYIRVRNGDSGAPTANIYKVYGIPG